MNVPLIPNAAAADNAATAARLDVVTVIRSTHPASIGKSYDVRGGEVVKHQVANITEGEARSHVIGTADALADLLRQVSGRTDTALCPALWNNDDGQPFDLVTEGELARLTGHSVGSQELAGVLSLNREGRRRIAARLRRGLQPAAWLMLDLDNPEGITDELRALNMAERLATFAELVPGIDTCERVELRGSSARVLAPGATPGGATHAYVRINDPHMIETLKAFVSIKMVTAGLSFPSPRQSRVDGTVIGHVHRTVFDLAVWSPGRLIFCAKPAISAAMEAAGWKVVDADVRIVNPGGGPLDVSGFEVPDADMLAEYRRITGERVTLTNEGRSVATRSVGLLTLETEIEVRGLFNSFAGWLDTMQDGATLRCEAPFRASVSEAAFIRRTGPRAGYIHDIGCATTFTLDVEALRAEAVADLGERLNAVVPADRIAATLAASEARNAADAVTTETSAMRAQGERAQVVYAPGVEHLLVQRVLEELPRLNPPMFRHAGGLVYVSKSREVRMFDNEGRPTLLKTTAMERVRPLLLGTELAKNLDFVKLKPGSQPRTSRENPNPVRGAPVVTSIDVPRVIVSKVMETTMETVPTISGIISTPTMRPDGSLLTANGFDNDTGFWLDHDLVLSVPETPTKEDAQAAFEVLCELLAGFPFDDDVSETVAVAHMMGAVLRPAFPTMPGLMIDAPAAGSGKSYLTKTIGYLAHGIVPAVSNWPKGEEFVKHLHAMLVAGVPYIAYDNCNGADIGGDLICSMLTEPQVKVRILGETREITAPTTGVVLTINGNHPRIKEDATQRFMTCYIRPDVANPRERVFDSDPLDLLRQDRGRYVSAVLTIAKAYIVAGRPDATGYGSFELWSRLVRSSLIWVAGDDVLATTRAAIAEDPERVKLVDVVGLVLAAMGTGGRWTIKKLMQRLAERDPLQPQILGGLVGAAAGRGGLSDAGTLNRAVGDYLRSKRDSIVTVDHDGRRLDVKLARYGERNERGQLRQTSGVAYWTVAVARDHGPSTPGGEG